MNLIVTDHNIWTDYFSQRTRRAGSKPCALDERQEVPNKREGIWKRLMDRDGKWVGEGR